jgi:long-chain acyl-CoA synthetase
VQQIDMPAIVPSDKNTNATEILLERLAKTPNLAIFSLPDGSGGWTPLTVSEFHARVIAVAQGLIAAGIQPGDKIGLMCKTRFEWTLLDFAAWFAGAILVPIYETSSSSQIEWILDDSESVALVVESATHRERFEGVRAALPKIHTVWTIDDGAIEDLVNLGKKVDASQVDKRRVAAKGDDMATLIYTSGSTGRPKGCVLTHANFVDLSRNARAAIPEVVNESSSTLLFIPLAHIFARYISVLAIEGGVRVGHQPDTTLLLPSLQSFQPTFLLAVPRVFEKVYNSAEQKAEAGGKGNIFRTAAKTAVEYSMARESGHVGLALKLRFRLFDRLVFGKLREAMGGNVRWAVSGSAPLGKRLGHFFNALGITVLEGYGLTETTAPATINRPSRVKIGTVGPALPGVSVRIADDGEIEVRGIDVFKEYWKNPKATKETFHDGWFKTGDIGSLDDDGYLSITGRKKEIIVTSGGKNVSPAFLEDPIRADPVVGQVVVVGDRQPFISALVTLDSEMLPMWLTNNKLDAKMSLAEASRNPAVRAHVQKAIDRANARVSQAESIRKFEILPIEFTEASGHLTPKLSIKRHVIEKDFEKEISEIYASKNPTESIETEVV